MTGTNRQNANIRWSNWTLANVDVCLRLERRERLLRKCITGADSERILKIHIEQPDGGVYCPYSRAVISVTGDENRATN
jgi:hypothetical protein